jgi:glycosyltransferase involved in cell wall biosynthesis
MIDVLGRLPERHRSLPLLVRALDRGAERQVEKLAAAGMCLVRLPWLNRPEMIAAYLGSSVVFAPTIAEGFGFPALEGLVCGCKVVSAPVEHLAGRPLEGLFLCDPLSADSMAQALTAAIEAGRTEAAANLRRRIERFRNPAAVDERLRRTLRDTCRETFRIYREVALRLAIR